MRLVTNRWRGNWYRRGQQLLACCVCLLGFGMSLPVDATAGEAYYDASVPVANQSDAEKYRALRESLQQVLMRLSGQTDFSSNTVVQEALGNPEPYLRQFGYASLASTETTAPHNVGQTETMLVNASFVPASVTALLRRAQLPLWPVNRPSVLAWVAVDAGNGKEMANQVDGAQDFLLKEAARRGLPLVMPMNDLNDQVALGDRLWDLDPSAIGEASKRYGEGSILAGKVTQLSPGKWQGNWLYILNGQPVTIENASDTLEDFFAAGIQLAVQTQVQRYGMTTVAGSNSAVDIAVSGVGDLQGYTDTLFFLQKIEMVNTVKVVAINGDQIHYALDISGSSASLQDMISLGKMLVPDMPAITTTPETVAGNPAADNVTSLQYHYVEH